MPSSSRNPRPLGLGGCQKATWLDEFPQGTTWSATGLDDGAEHFYAIIEYAAKVKYADVFFFMDRMRGSDDLDILPDLKDGDSYC